LIDSIRISKIVIQNKNRRIAMSIAVGQVYKHKYSNNNYIIYDVVGLGGAVPSETPIVFLKLASRPALLSNPQLYITITGRQLLDYFDPIIHK